MLLGVGSLLTALLTRIVVFAVDPVRGTFCDVKLNSSVTINGSITSPGFPGQYPPHSTCRYEFTANKPHERVQLVFTDFSLFVGTPYRECEGNSIDSVVVFVGSDLKMDQIDRYCGHKLPRPIMSNGPRLVVIFNSSNSSPHARGFRAKYSFTKNFGIVNGDQSSEGCYFTYRVESNPQGHFYSPNFPGLYPRDTVCHYVFMGPATLSAHRYRVALHFHYFDVEGVFPCNDDTASDYLEFSNFPEAQDRKYRRVCGHFPSGMRLESEKSFFRVTFHSNDRLDGTGFNATYQFVELSSPSTTKLTAVVVVATQSSSNSSTPSCSRFSPTVILLLLKLYGLFY